LRSSWSSGVVKEDVELEEEEEEEELEEPEAVEEDLEG
jgi:hypothetical protein